MLKSELELSVQEQISRVKKRPIGIPRLMLDQISLTKEFSVIITGIRRCGKSTLMLQLLNEIKESISYINFEDPRLFNFGPEDFVKIHEVLSDDYQYLFFDEIQNIDQWERMIRHFHDLGKKMCITGSNASLLSRDLGSKLTGRHLSIELFPFSYAEYLCFREENSSQEQFETYLLEGGFPDYLKYGLQESLQQLFKDILNRDIIVRYGVRNSNTLISIALFLISNVGKPYSLTKIRKAFDVGSTNSVADYVNWMEDSYLIFSLPKFSYSPRKISVNPKKIYCIDSGFAKANSLSYSDDLGRLFENAVFLHLRRTYKELYYFQEKGECDFLVKQGPKITSAIQVCYLLTSDNMDREVNGLLEAMEYFNLESGTIVTMNEEDELVRKGKRIKIIKAHNWFL